MALYYLYRTDIGNTLISGSTTSFAPLPPNTGEILSAFLPAALDQSLYYYRESGGTIVENTEENILAGIELLRTPNYNQEIDQIQRATEQITSYFGLPSVTFDNQSGSTEQFTDTVLSGFTLTEDEINERVEWLDIYSGGTYLKNQMVYDAGWTMIANKDTTDRAAPLAVGNPFNAYTGISTTINQASAKQIVFGTQYDSVNPYWLNGYRVYVVAGNEYEIISVLDVGASNEAGFINRFTADVTGWREFNLIPRPIDSGATFQLLAIVNEPDPTPTEVTYNYDYIKPNNATVPISGQITHANKDLSSVLINKIDDDLVDRGAFLLGLNIGDKITIGTTQWAIQAIVDDGSYVDFTVAPLRQSLLSGVVGVIFETVTATPISYFVDSDYWSGSTVVKGVFGVDTGYEDVTTDDNQYGIDLLVQSAYVSPDWDFVASAGGVNGGNSISDIIWGNIDGNINNQLDLQEQFSGKTNIVTGATSNVPIFTADGNIEDSGYAISDLTGGTTGATDIYVTGATLVGDVLNLERNGGLPDVTADLQAIGDAISQNASDIQLVSGETTQNASDISDNSSDIVTISGQTDQNTSDIQLVSGVTTQNSSDIATVSGQTDQNTSDIQLVSGVTTQNTSDIGDNASDISTVSGQTDQNTSDILDNTNDITYISGETASNDADITYLSGQTDLKLNTSDFNIYSGVTDTKIDTKIDKVTGATGSTIPTFVVGGNIEDSGKEFTITIGSQSLATDNKVPTELAVRNAIESAVAGAVQLQGDWDANTNTPDLTVTGITTGYAWRVNVSGNTNLDGITDWDIGDLAIKSATGWIKVENQDVGAVWGNIVGTISDQTDLQLVLDGKLNITSFNIYTGTTDTRLSGIESDIQLVSGVTTQNTGDINYISGVTDTKIDKVPTATENNIALFTNDGQIKDDGFSITAATESVKFQSVKNGDQLVTATQDAIISWNSPSVINSSYYSFDNVTGELTFTQDGWYDINYNAAVKNVGAGNNRSEGETWLQEDLSSTGFTNIDGTRADYYLRQANYGASGGAELLKYYTNGQKIRITFQRTAGSAVFRLMANSTILKVVKSERSINTVQTIYITTGGTAVVGQSEFNGYTGITETRIQGIESDVVNLSGATDQNASDITYLSGQTDLKLNTSDFNIYSGVTDTKIDTKIDKVTGATGNLAIFLPDGNVEDSGVTIDSITGGTGFYFYEDRTARINNTTTTDVVYISGVSSSLQAGTWSLDFNALGGNIGNNKSIVVGFYIDGVLLGVENSIQANASTNVIPFALTKDGVLTSGVHTFEIKFRQLGGGTAFLEYASVRARLVS